MKLVKLSLVAALAVGSFSALEAKPLEDAIKNVDLSGFAWYRYDTGRFTSKTLKASDPKGYDLDAGGIPYPQTHRYRVGLTTKVGMGDGFTAVGMLLYNSLDHSFDGSTYKQGANTKQPIWLKQAYLQYEAADLGMTFTLGRQNLGTIWTDDLAGMAAKVLIRPTDGVTVSAFAVDSFQSGDDEASFCSYTGDCGADQPNTGGRLNSRLYKENLYGAAVLGDFGPIKAELWGANWDKTATLYAVKLDYKLKFGGKDSKDHFRIHANYLGNVVDGSLQTDAKAATGHDFDLLAGGNLYNLKAEVKIIGLDVNIGGIMFGKKHKFSLNTLEEPFGNDGDLYIGSEVFYQKGSWAVLSIGQSTYGYFGAGYTFPHDIRFGIRGVYGETKEAGLVKGDTITNAKNGGGKKMEGVAELSWQVNNNLDFITYYSYLHTKAEKGREVGDELLDAKSAKNTVRFQAKYSFK